MSSKKRSWRNPPKYLETTTEGKCPYCLNYFESLEHHMHDKHKGTKGFEKELYELKLRGYHKKYK